MSDFKEGQGVKTHEDNDFCTKVADGQSGATATHKLSVVGDGDTKTADVNDFGIPMMVEKEDGTYCLPAADDNCNLKVVSVDPDDEAKTHSYKNHSAVTATSGTDDHDSAAITSAKTVRKIDVLVSSPGCMKFEIGEFDGITTFTVRHVIWTQPASPTFSCKGLCIPEITGDGSITLRIRASNKDDTDNDAYSSICYSELD